MLRLCICRCPPARSAKNGRRTTNDVANGPPFPSLLISRPVYLTPTYPTYPQQNPLSPYPRTGTIAHSCGYIGSSSFFPSSLISSIFLVGFAFSPLFLSVLVLLAASLRLFFSFLLCKISLLNNPPAPPCGLWLRDSPLLFYCIINWFSGLFFLSTSLFLSLFAIPILLLYLYALRYGFL